MKTEKIERKNIRYVIEIKSENGKISGYFVQKKTFKNGNIREKKIPFDPTIFFIDLFKNTPNQITTKSIFNIPSKNWLQFEEKQFIKFLYKSIKNNLNYNIYDLEVLKLLMGVELRYTIKYGIPSYVIDTKSSGDINLTKENYTDREIKKLGGMRKINYVPYVLSDLDEIAEGKKKIFRSGRADSIYVYNCSSVIEILFSIFHYLVINNYQITTCKHCGKDFFTINKKRYLCNRKTPYRYMKEVRKEKDRLNERTCVEAVDLIRKRFSNRKKSIIENYAMQNAEDGGYDPEKEKENFIYEANSKSKKMKKNPSIDNIREYEKFLYDRPRKKRIIFRQSKNGVDIKPRSFY